MKQILFYDEDFYNEEADAFSKQMIKQPLTIPTAYKLFVTADVPLEVMEKINAELVELFVNSSLTDADVMRISCAQVDAGDRIVEHFLKHFESYLGDVDGSIALISEEEWSHRLYELTPA